jgi:nitroreductase
MDAIEAIVSRRSVRGFRPDPVSKETVVRLLDIAARAPSGSNIQPWKVYALAGEARERLCRALHAARAEAPEAQTPQYQYYPVHWREPYLGRRRKVGWDLYALCGISRGDKDKMFQQHSRNFDFFGAPIGLLFTLDADMELGSWIDMGIFLQSVMVAARGLGLHTCPQAAWAYHHDLVRKIVPLPEQEKLVCGMALGHEDQSEAANALITERVPAAGFTRFLGF